MTVGHFEARSLVSPTGQPNVRRPLTPENELKTMRAAKDFESMTLDQMLQPMFATVDADPLFGGGEAEKTLRPMLITEMAKLMEERGGFGLSSAIEEKMNQMQKNQR